MFNITLSDYNDRIKKYREDFDDYDDSSLFTGERFVGGLFFDFFEKEGVPMETCSIAVLDVRTGRIVDFFVYTAKMLVANSLGLFCGVNESLFLDKVMDGLFIKPDVLIMEENDIFDEKVSMLASEYLFFNNYTNIPIIGVSKIAVPGYIKREEKRINNNAPCFREVISSAMENFGIYIKDLHLSLRSFGATNEDAFEFLWNLSIFDDKGNINILEKAKELSTKPFSEQIHVDFLRDVSFDILADFLNIKGCREFLLLLNYSGFFDRLSKSDIQDIVKSNALECHFKHFKKDRIVVEFEKKKSSVSFLIGTIDSKGEFLFKELVLPNFDDNFLETIDYYSKVFEKNSKEQKEFLYRLKKGV